MKGTRWGDYLGLSGGPSTTSRVLIRPRKRKTGHRRAGGHATSEAETGVMRPQAEQCRQPLEAGRGKTGILPQSLWREHSQLKPSILTQENCQRMNFYCFEPLGFWKFVTVAIGNYGRGKKRFGKLEKERWLRIPTTDFISPNIVLWL